MQKLTGDDLKGVWAKLSTLSEPVFVSNVIAWHRQARPHLELKTRPRFRPVGLIFAVIRGTGANTNFLSFSRI